MRLSDLATGEAVAVRSDHTRVQVPRGTAPVGLRLAAAAVDLALVALPLTVGALIVHSLRDANGGGVVDRVVFGGFAIAVATAVHVWNHGFGQGRRGASTGKAWLGLIARGPDGRPLGVRNSLLVATPRQVVRRITAVDEGFTEVVVDLTPARLRLRRAVGVLALLIVLAVLLLASVAVGSRPLAFGEIWHGLLPPYDANPTEADLIVRDLRMPRTLLGLVTGIALGLAGGLIQGHTRNPLADPGILGVSAGAACAVVVAIMFLDVTSAGGYIWFALAGALIASSVVFGLSTIGGGNPSPVSLVLGGAAVAAFLSAITSAVVLLDQATLDAYRFWVVGSVSGRGIEVLTPLLPFFAVGIVLAVANGPGLNVLSLGEEVARSLGTNIALNRILGITAITLLAGAATAACGPIAFIGLAVPHVARAFTGPDYRWLLPCSALIGAVMLITCDIIGRVAARPGELQVGIVLALVGAPFFIALVRRRKLVTL
ncbi:iron complex transport system permease protein [Nocardioides albertanoniae]|uniref:Iron complex transport system permease protein n=1 Tax=Nocardioides albertanoniae TaxID=1175486 RepID=A0A543A5T0_9ACTN|nr:iron ABC transporter permease [Nocardioides albertanoniae]TQL67963.1 iron complex transport system permease protein [Nocardioides albertanoniae]